MAAWLVVSIAGLILAAYSSAGVGDGGIMDFEIFITFLAEYLCVHVDKQ